MRAWQAPQPPAARVAPALSRATEGWKSLLWRQRRRSKLPPCNAFSVQKVAMDMMKQDLQLAECPFAWNASFDREDGSWQYNNEGALRVRQRKPAGVTLRTARRLPSSGTGVSAEADKSRGFPGRPHGAKAEPPGLHMRLDDALQRALEHPKYRMTGMHASMREPS